MTNKNTQHLINKWIKIYQEESDEDLRKIYAEEFLNSSTPRREEDKARKKALEALVGSSSHVVSREELEFGKALAEASKWQEQLTEYERSKIGFSTARKIVLGRIFKKYKGIIK